MRIRLTVIPLDDLDRVRPLVDALRNAVNSGDMDGMDTATEKLTTITATGHSIDLPEEEWRRFLAKIRAKNPEFQSDYLLSGGLCTEYFSKVTSETMVLQLPIDKKEGNYV